MLAIATMFVCDLLLGRRLDAPQARCPSCPRSSACRAGTRPCAGTGCRAPRCRRPPRTARSATGSSGRPSPTSACPTNSASTLNIMKTFHSSGTPIGIDDRMPKWKHSMTMRRDRRRPAAVAEEQHQRHQALDRGARSARRKRDARPGRRSSGKLLEEPALDASAAASTGLLLIIVEMTNGKCLLSLDVAAPIQITRQTSLAAMIMSTPTAEQERHRERRVHLAAGGQEDHLVAQADARRAGRGSSRSATSAARPTVGAECRDRPGAVGEQRDHQHHQQRGVEQRRRPACARRPWSAGSRLGHGGSRMVLGRNQYRIEPIGGKNRLFSGPNPQPSPTTSNSIV